ncbi:MAG: PP2C family protein-serine/threonine phosphatase [Pseudonocardia sp.]
MTVQPTLTQVARRVLLVEDDPGDALLVRELLATIDAPIELTHVSSVAEAVASGHLDLVDCVLLDLNLPGTGTDRLDALRQLREHGTASAICVLTGLDDEHLGAAAMAAGAQDYLVKGSVDGELLSRSVRYSVERRRAERNAVRLAEAQLVQAESVRVERGLLPRLLLHGSHVAAVPFYRSWRPGLLGGDFYDAIRCPDGSVHAVVGDVAGHGSDEAALGALLRVSWRALVLSGVGEPEVLPALQAVLLAERHARGLFTTLCTVALADGEARIRVAGHPPPIMLGSAPGQPPVELPHALGPPLGVIDDARWEPRTVVLPPRWSMLLYTDGLIEGFSGPERTDRLWNTGLLPLVGEVERNGAGVAGPRHLPTRLVEQVERLNGGPLGDDVAILLLSSLTDPAPEANPGN